MTSQHLLGESLQATEEIGGVPTYPLESSIILLAHDCVRSAKSADLETTWWLIVLRQHVCKDRVLTRYWVTIDTFIVGTPNEL